MYDDDDEVEESQLVSYGKMILLFSLHLKPRMIRKFCVWNMLAGRSLLLPTY